MLVGKGFCGIMIIDLGLVFGVIFVVIGIGECDDMFFIFVIVNFVFENFMVRFFEKLSWIFFGVVMVELVCGIEFFNFGWVIVEKVMFIMRLFVRMVLFKIDILFICLVECFILVC